jgi:diaminohydroxyphosphoribosylaminopyrimidine deaminase/5-amino-6-(5-phosphoribosylamino)uracil reductase
MSKVENHHWNMRRALRLAKKALGWTKPNPLVGAVLVYEGERIGEGFHEQFGEAHAEVKAIQDAINRGHAAKLKDSTLYVTLEPCNHQGKTGACTELILKHGIKRVVIAMKDPNPIVKGRGIQKLRENEIEVIEDINEEEARELNREYILFHEKERPWITLKCAMSLDGKLGYPDEETKLTEKKAQKQSHLLRHKHQAILIGAGTLLSDDPHLGVRLIEGQDPLRLIIKGKRDLPKNAQVFRDSNYQIIENQNIHEIMTHCHKEGIQSILVEGGAKILTAFIQAKLADEVHAFISPTLLGVKALAFNLSEERISLELKSVQKWGQDIQLVYTPKWDSLPS